MSTSLAFTELSNCAALTAVLLLDEDVGADVVADEEAFSRGNCEISSINASAI